jgi:hypothetical protein
VGNVRNSWLTRITIAALAFVAVLFVAHLGADSHSDECHACQIASHAFCEDTAPSEYVPAQTVCPSAPLEFVAGPAAAMTRGAPPRAPPTS